MRTLLLVIIAGIAGALVGGAVAFAATFFGLYGICWCISRLAGDEDWMMLMWFGIPIGILAGITGLLTGGICLASFAADRLSASEVRGFEVVGKTTDQDSQNRQQ